MIKVAPLRLCQEQTISLSCIKKIAEGFPGITTGSKNSTFNPPWANNEIAEHQIDLQVLMTEMFIFSESAIHRCS